MIKKIPIKGALKKEIICAVKDKKTQTTVNGNKGMKNQIKLNKLNDEVYVVTRRGRRVEPDNYQEKEDAQVRAKKLFDQLKDWNDPDRNKVSVVKTATPHKIY